MMKEQLKALQELSKTLKTGYENSMAQLENSVSDMPEEEAKKTRLIIDSIKECGENRDIKGLMKLMKKCRHQ